MWSRYLKLYVGTKPEQLFERELAKRGRRYRWQMPIWRYVVDFALPDDKLIIEVDGESHLRPAQIEKDRERTAYFESKGWRVVRIWNEEVLADAAGAVAKCLAPLQDQPPKPQPKARKARKR